MDTKPTNVDEYIASFPDGIREKLEQVRDAVKKTAPQAIEVMSYGMPGYKFHGMLVWFGGHTKHIGFYPKASGIAAFQDKLSKYKCSKGAIQFPITQAFPLDLITEIVRYRVGENMEIAETKSKKGK